ncbi:hypothetical protein [Hoeflea poritis]|uniref:Uncharacterized protein n=1 Tax=Hoeflea poritis TaxID=2993659 RepID=A0ABT4VJ46_9HYPH|nr:hypothetical protein [Hoeflea poritis]MDA4844147.1 hypothetical protein [Hoeflea poritis]
MMHRLQVCILLLATWALCAPALSDSATLYEGPLPVKIKDKSLELPVVLSGQTAAGDDDMLLLQVAARTQDLAPILKEQLQSLADDNISACELRIKVPEAAVGANGQLLVLAATVSAEAWVCTSFLKTRLGSETATITAGVTPEIRDGRLYLEPDTLTIDGIGDLIASIGGDRVMQNLYFQAVDRFNKDPKLTALPEKLSTAGFAYQSVGVEAASPQRLTVTIAGPNDLANLAKIIAGIQ